MNLVTINIDSIRVGQPLPFSIRDETGALLAPKGYVVLSQANLDLVTQNRKNLFADVSESESQRRAFVGKLHSMVRDDLALGQIAESQFSSFELEPAANVVDTGEPNWLDLQSQTYALLRDPNPASFCGRLDKLHQQLSYLSRINPDGTLFALVHLSSSELQLYSATHAMLVSVMCGLAAREVLKWPPEMEAILCRSALTMNIGMTELQDRLAQQKQAVSADQRRLIDQHADRSARILGQLGIDEPLHIEAVLWHHIKIPGPLAGRPPGQRMARLIQRADMFASRLAPRISRYPESPASAMQASYFDENRQVDEAGAALIKAMGIYTPGSYVRLASEEIAVVVKRGANTTTPRVAILINRAGMPTGEMIVRDTSKPEFRILAGVPHRDVNVKLNLERLLLLTKTAAPDRPW